MAEEDEGAIGADWAMGAEGAEESEGVVGAEEDTTGIGYMAIWGFGAKCWMEWSGWMDGWIPLRLLRLLEHLQC